jgi:hypothetical protein
MMAVLDSIEMDYSGSDHAWRYGGGRDLSRVLEDARQVGNESHVA